MSHYPAPPAFSPGWMSASRGAALGLGTLMLLNAAERRVLNLSGSQTWLGSFHPLDPGLILALLALAGTALVLFAARPAMPDPVRWVTLITSGIVFVFVISDLVRSLPADAAQIDPVPLFRPLSILVVICVAGCGLMSSKRLLPIARPPIFSVPLLAVLSVAGILVATVRSGMAADVIPPQTQTDVVLVVDTPATGQDADSLRARCRIAARQLQQDASALLFVFELAELTEEQSEEVRQLVTAEGIAAERITRQRHVADVVATVDDAIRLAEERRAEQSVDESRPPQADAILWLGDPVHFATVRLAAARHGRSLLCHSGSDAAESASRESSVVPATLTYGQLLLKPLSIR